MIPFQCSISYQVKNSLKRKGCLKLGYKEMEIQIKNVKQAVSVLESYYYDTLSRLWLLFFTNV